MQGSQIAMLGSKKKFNKIDLRPFMQFVVIMVHVLISILGLVLSLSLIMCLCLSCYLTLVKESPRKVVLTVTRFIRVLSKCLDVYGYEINGSLKRLY